MTKLRAFYLLLLISALSVTVYFQAWNIGHDVGYSSGYNTAILEGRIEVECKFAPRCIKEYEQGYQEGLQGFIEMQCGKPNGDSYEPDSLTL